MRLTVALGLLFVVILDFVVCKSVKQSGGTNEGNGGKSCRLLELPLQEDLDLQQFEGLWYGTMKTGMGDSMLSYFTEIYDARIHFKTNFEGGYDLKAAGSKFYGGWCPKGKGTAVIPDKSSPARMTMFFDTTIGRKIGMKPAWILKTDYTSYAIIYSCWKEASNGQCDSSQAYAAVIQRNPKPLSKSAQAEVARALKSACVDIKNLSKVTHYGYCVSKEGL